MAQGLPRHRPLHRRRRLLPLTMLARHRPQDGTMLVGQAVLDPPPGYATPYSRGAADGSGGAPLVRVLPADCFHSFKRLLGKT